LFFCEESMDKLKQFTLGAFSAAVGILGVKSYRQYRRDLTIAEERIQAQTQTIETAVGRMVYNTSGAGTPVLVIHGAGGGFDQALHVAQNFGGGFQWIAPCRFGYLGSDLPKDASPEAQADAYAALLDALEIERVPIIGISAGGPSAIQFALRHPERCLGLVLIAAVSKAMIDVIPNPENMEKIFDWSLASDWPIWLGLQLAIHKIRHPLGVPASVMQQISADDQAWLQTLLSYELPVQPRRPGLVNDFATIIRLDIFPLEQIQTPTLVIHARDDSLVSIQHAHFSAGHIPNTRLVELSSGGHLLLGQRERLRAEIEPFLEKVITP
jgi:2-hydroxy-6-oxonona-2,4-dienedioate hydrolase